LVGRQIKNMAQRRRTTPKIPSNQFVIELKNFYMGLSPLAHLDSLTQKGNEGHASTMTDCDILNGYIAQGPGLANLTNGTQVGAVKELIKFILDVPTSNNTTYGIGTTKLFEISSTTVTNDGTYPHTITNCTDGSSVAYLLGNGYYFYNKSSGGDIGKIIFGSPDDFDDDWGSTTPTGKASLQKAPHPVAVKEDLMAFGNGQYLGVYIADTNTLAPTKLDFGNNCEVDDVIFHANYWYIAVNGGITGTNRSIGQIYLYDGAATESILADETGVGFQKIGFLYVLDGIDKVTYKDLSSTGGYNIGYILGRQIKKLASFTGTLPTFAQKTLYQHTILFLSSGSLWSFGAVSPDLPAQVSQITDGGYATCGALAAPFGTPMVASTDNTNYRLAKFSGYTTTTAWKSIVIPTASGYLLGYIDNITVSTNSLGANARMDLVIEADQATRTSNSKSITTTGKMRHIFDTFGLGEVSDFRVALSASNGSTSNVVKIRNIIIKGHWCSSG